MPAQDNEKEAVKPQEVLDDTVAHKSEALLPVLNFVYENQMNRLDDLQEQKAEVQDGIGRNEDKIAVLQEKAERLEATNTMLRELMDTEKLPKAEGQAQKTMQQLEKDGIAYSARLNGEKSAVTVRKSEAPVYFKRNQIKKLAQEAKDEKSDPSKTKSKSKGQEIG